VAIYQTMVKVYDATSRTDFAARAKKMASQLGGAA
jgi:hypothetical protein